MDELIKILTEIEPYQGKALGELIIGEMKGIKSDDYTAVINIIITAVKKVQELEESIDFLTRD